MYYPDSVIRIKKESFALRCEICHQVDCFDPMANYCSRCEFVSIQETKSKETNASTGSYLFYLLLTQISHKLL
jgi:hypothetical protein